MATQLNYDIVPDKSPLYTTVDQLNQSTCALQVTVTNAHSTPITLEVIEIELKKVDQGVDSVQLLLPGSEGGIACPQSLTGPGGSNWSITNNDGKLTLKPTPDGSTVTFQPKDSLSFTLQNVVIREGRTGSAFVPVLEESSSGRGETTVGIGITQSTLNVQLSSDSHMVEPGGSAMLTWTTTDATSGTLVLPGNSPKSMTIPSTSLASGQQQVWPIGDTTYSLTCQGLGPNVTAEVPVNVDSLQMGELESSAEIVHVGEQVLLQWHTNADSCELHDGSANSKVSVPTTVPNAEYPQGFPVFPRTPTSYIVKGTKQLADGDFVDSSTTPNYVDVHPVQLTPLTSSADAFDASQTITLSWQTVDALTCALSTQEGTGSVNMLVANGQAASCKVSATPDGQTLIVTSADGSNQELGRITLPVPCPGSITFVLSATGVNPQTSKSEVTLIPPKIDTFQGIASPYWGGESNFEVLALSWSTSHASSVNVDVGSQAVGVTTELTLAGLTLPSGACYVVRPPGEVTITCQGFGGPITQQQNF